MKRPGLLLAGGAVLALAAAAAVRPRPAPAPLDPLPDFQATEAWSEKSISLADLKGRPWIASFLFTRCSGPCPLLAARISALQKTLPPEVRFVTFTVDPAHDTPEVLRGYAGRFEAAPARWAFLQMDKGDLYKLAYEGFRLPLGENPAADPAARIIHSTRLVLVDAQGRVNGLFESADEGLARKLLKALGGIQA